MFTPHTKLIAWGTALFFLFPALPVHADNLASQLPDIGTAGSTILTPREEKQLGHEFMRSVRKSLKLLDDPLAVDYLQNLADRLQPKLQESHQNITVFIVDDASINAFAGPGGFIGVHTGLMLAARTEGELASVIAHEIAHVSQRHLVRSFDASSKMSLSSFGAILAALVLGGNNPEVGEAVIASTVAGSAQQQLTFSRNHEQEADRVGLELLANADFDPRQMVSFFEVLQQRQRTLTLSSSFPEFLRTHPLTLARIADTRNRASQYPKYFPADLSEFQHIQSRIAALSHKTGPDPFSRVKNTNDPGKLAHQYYQGLIAAKNGSYNIARQQLKALLQKNTQRVLYHFSAAQIELSDSKPENAQKIILKALALFPGNPPLIELQGKILLQLKKPQEAFSTLKSALRKFPDHNYLYQTYAIAASRIGYEAEGYRALAEYEYRLGNIHQAVDYLSRALKSDKLGKYDRLSLEARLKELKTEAINRERDATIGGK